MDACCEAVAAEQAARYIPPCAAMRCCASCAHSAPALASPCSPAPAKAAAALGQLLRYYVVDPSVAQHLHRQNLGTDGADSCSMANFVDRSLEDRTPLMRFLRALVHGRREVAPVDPNMRPYAALCMAAESILLKAVKQVFASPLGNWLGAAVRDTGAHRGLWRALTVYGIAKSATRMEVKLAVELAAAGNPFYDSVAFRAARSAARAAGLGSCGPHGVDAMPLVTPRAGATAEPLGGPADFRSPTGQKLDPDWLRNSTLALDRWKAYYQQYYVDSRFELERPPGTASARTSHDAVEGDKLAEDRRKRHTTTSKDVIMDTPQFGNEHFCTVPFMAARLTQWCDEGYQGVPTEQAVKTAAGGSKGAMAELYLRTIDECGICLPTDEEVCALHPRATICARPDGPGYRVELDTEYYYPADAAILTLRTPLTVLNVVLV
ncbi:hypothetical protein T492DRAFT_893491 [Pavlovales sp. CCMP2436]|nr:hypothetical protein T492DRAFT_893491 [Pavlovales sp. CCMP2436]